MPEQLSRNSGLINRLNAGEFDKLVPVDCGGHAPPVYVTKAKANPTDTPSWWMIERHDLEPSPHYFAWKYRPGQLPETAPHGSHTWTPDWTLGEHFPTKGAAEEHTNGDPLLHVVEHCMMQPNTPSIDEELIERHINNARERFPAGKGDGYVLTWRQGEEIARLCLSDRAKLEEALKDLAEAARNACDARLHTPLIEALAEADYLLVRSTDRGSV